MKLIKYFDCTIVYHPRKTNVIANALSRKSSSVGNEGRITLLQELRDCKVILNVESVGNLVA